jgi:malate synthase
MYALKTDKESGGGRRTEGGLDIDPVFHRFVEGELLPAIEFDPQTFWQGLEAIINELTPVNRYLLQIRDELQQQIDDWHKARKGRAWERSIRFSSRSLDT